MKTKNEVLSAILKKVDYDLYKDLILHPEEPEEADRTIAELLKLIPDPFAQERYERLASVASEFIRDWKKGDFQLPSLAKCDARSIEEVLLEK